MMVAQGPPVVDTTHPRCTSRPSNSWKHWSWNLTGHCKANPYCFLFVPHQSLIRSLRALLSITSAQAEQVFWSFISAQVNSKMPPINICLPRTGTCILLQTPTKENISKPESYLQGLQILVLRDLLKKIQCSEVYNRSHRWCRTADFSKLTSCYSLTSFPSYTMMSK